MELEGSLKITTNLGHARVIVFDETMMICDLFIDEAARGQGHGSDLLAYVISLAHQLQCRKLTLHVSLSNTPAARLYRKAHFFPTGTEAHLELDIGT